MVKTFTWTKAKAGSNGTNAVVFSVYAPNGTVVQNQSGTLTLATSAYSGTTAITKSDMEMIRQDFQSSITQNSSEIRMDFTAVTDEIKDNVAANQQLLEEYIRFKGALIELGKVGNSFTAGQHYTDQCTGSFLWRHRSNHCSECQD